MLSHVFGIRQLRPHINSSHRAVQGERLGPMLLPAAYVPHSCSSAPTFGLGPSLAGLLLVRAVRQCHSLSLRSSFSGSVSQIAAQRIGAHTFLSERRKRLYACQRRGTVRAAALR